MNINQDAKNLQADWDGPFSWPNFESENGLPTIPLHSTGVYLQTFEYQNGYLIYAAGITRRSVPVRFKEHTRHYMNGDYTVLDPLAAERGIRKEIWHGWGYAKVHRDQFEENKVEIQEAVKKQLAKFRVFYANFRNEQRLLERVEAAIMNFLYEQKSPYKDLPDKGMMLAPRWNSEEPQTLNNRSKVTIHGLPEALKI
ncbi:MAG: hypothetical protein RQ739_14805 [Desulfotignum sp.]|nr:hypothetical protein [Desulfotignum sp.]